MRNVEKYVKNLKTFGESEIDVTAIIKDWDDNFSISLSDKEGDRQFTFLIFLRKEMKFFLKTKITQKDAFEIIEKLKLVRVYSAIFNSASYFCTVPFCETEVFRLNSMLLQCTDIEGAKSINEDLFCLINALNSQKSPNNSPTNKPKLCRESGFESNR